MLEKHKEVCSCSRFQGIDGFVLDRLSAERSGFKLSYVKIELSSVASSC